jgi:mono/diheme cytochrome c family protein
MRARTLLFLAPLVVASVGAHPRIRKLPPATAGGTKVLATTRAPGSVFRAVAAGPGDEAWALDAEGRLHGRLPASGRWVIFPGAKPRGIMWTLARGPEGVVVGAPLGGLDVHRGPRWEPVDDVGPIHDLFVLGDELWIASSDALLRKRVGERPTRVKTPEGSTGPRRLAGEGTRLVVAFEDGTVARREGGEWRDLGCPRQPVQALAVGPGGVVAGGPGWLAARDEETGTWQDLRESLPGLEGLHVTALVSRGTELWVATMANGVLCRREGAWEQLAPPFLDVGDGVVHALAAAGPGEVLAATDRGLTSLRVVRRGSQPNDVEAWIPKTDVPEETDLSRSIPEPRQLFASVAAGGKLSPLATRGDMIFEDPSILGERAKRMGISCGTCHPRGHTNTNLFIEGISVRRGGVDLTNGHFSARADNGVLDPVDTPSLRGLRHTSPYGRTHQAPDIRKFTRNVIVLEFEGPEPSDDVLDALTAYQREFEFLPTRWVGDDGRLSPEAPASVKRGEALFRGPMPGLPGGACATCHPPHAFFTDGRMHDVGTGGAFDVPSLRNANYSPPYSHDGRFATYREVLEHYQSTFGLGLDSRQVLDLESYLQAVGEGLRPYE